MNKNSKKVVKGAVNKVEIPGIEQCFLLAYIIDATIQIYMINNFKKNNNIRDWYNFLGVNIGIFICDIFVYVILSNNALGLSSALSCIIVCGFVLCTNFILLIIGLVIKNKIKDTTNITNPIMEDKSIKSLFPKSSIYVLICNILIVFIFPFLIQQISLKSREKYIVNYLENKYGNGNYKVVDIKGDYTYNGIIDKYLSGYYYEIKSDYMNNTFIIRIDDRVLYIEDDYFLPLYYSEKYNLPYELSYSDSMQSLYVDFNEFEKYIINSIKAKYPLETKKIDVNKLYMNFVQSYDNIKGVTYNSSYFIIPENYGKIPSINELDELLVKYY